MIHKDLLGFHPEIMNDLCLGRILPVIDELGGMAIIIADHGNCDEMYEIKKGKVVLNPDGKPKAKTSHTLNPVPCIFYDNTPNRDNYVIKEGSFGLSNVAASALFLMGMNAPEGWDESIVCNK